MHAFGSFLRRSDRTRVLRYRCARCKKSFSEATLTLEWRQKKRHINAPLEHLICSGVTFRRSARILGVHRSTTLRRLKYLARRAELWQREFLSGFQAGSEIQFDEMESLEQTKLKPLSIPLLVDKQTRKILAFDVASMPAKGVLASMSRKKYGPRKDERSAAIEKLLEDLSPRLTSCQIIRSDDCPRYPRPMRRHLPRLKHLRCAGGRSCVLGLGELKRKVYDPLFSLNHTAAMLRANLSRLQRRTWSVSKKAENLKHHIQVYIRYHNEVLTAL